jgi:hypothetical protein
MTLAIASDAAVRAEIWQSFLGVLKCYAAVASLSATPHLVLAENSDSIVIASGSTSLSFNFDPEAGEGSWTLKSGSAADQDGLFALGANGMLTYDGPAGRVAEDLDHAAIRMVGLLTSTATRHEIEVPV